MIFFFRKADIQNNRVRVLNIGEQLMKSGRQFPFPPIATRIIELDIIPQVGGVLADYGWFEILDNQVPSALGRAKEIILECGAGGQATAIDEWHSTIEITSPMQLTVSNGPYGSYMLNLPLADRQVNLIADPVYATIIEISIIRNDTTGALDVWHRENEGPMPAGYELVQSLLKFTLPAGTKDLKELNLGL